LGYFFYQGATTLVGQGLLIIEDSWLHSLGRTPLDEWSARYNTHKRQTSMPRRDLNPQSQQASGCRPMP